MDILIDDQHNRHGIAVDEIREAAAIILNSLDKSDAELSIVIVDDLKIAELNQHYLNRQGPTNVIAFPMQEGDFTHVNPFLLGDVVISADTAAKEGQIAGIGTTMRFYELLIHGILHLCGYDHEASEAEALRMEQKAAWLEQMIRARLK